eukprot:m.25825 g.25825  ORF g.25825 m.25825 type:complete len:359 (+) comp7740_c0_seq2:69-1145(+)
MNQWIIQICTYNVVVVLFFVQSIFVCAVDLKQLPSQYLNASCPGPHLPPLKNPNPPTELEFQPFARKKREQERNLNLPRRFVYFAHIHKGGGTTLCHIARFNGEIVGPKNCNVDPDLYPGSCWTRTKCKGSYEIPTDNGPGRIHPAHQNTSDLIRGSLEQQCHFLTGTRLSFISDEGGAPTQLLPGITGITILRHPLNRALSEWHHAKKGREATMPGFPTTFIEFVKRKWFLKDFMVRTLVGPELRGDNLTRHHLDIVKTRLSQEFKLVLILEMFDPYGLQLLKSELGWVTRPKKTAASKLGTAKHGSSRMSNYTVELSSAEISWMKEHNALDMELYEYSRTLFLKRVEYQTHSNQTS